MENVMEGTVSDGVSLAVNGLTLDSNWNNSQNSNNPNVVYIAVEYVKDNEFKLDAEPEMSSQAFNDFEQHVSPLDPNMCSVAQYSPVYTSDNTYNNPIVLVTNDTPEILSCQTGQVVSTRLLQMVNEHELHTPEPVLPNQNENDQVELLITDQSTGIQYCVNKEYIVERCLTDEHQLLENLAPDTLLDTDFLALDEGVLKSQISEIIVDAAQNINKLSKGNIKAELTTEHYKDEDDNRRSLRNVENIESDPERELLSCVRPISDKPVPTRAWATLPESYLTIQKTSETKIGVFAKKLIPKLTQFGPLEGSYTSLTDKKPKDNHMDFYVEDSTGQVVRIDLSSEDTSNWMRFVQPARTHAEQNLVVVEIDSALYFINKGNILPKQELKVGYSKAYATRYQLDILEPVPEELHTWPCYECNSQFSSSYDLQKHLNVHDVGETTPKKKRRKLKSKKYDYVKCNTCPDKSIKEEVTTTVNAIKLEIDAENAVKGTVASSVNPIVAEEFPCQHCNARFGAEAQLLYHMNMKHGSKLSKKSGKGLLDCPVCRKTFTTLERRQRHMLVHGSDDAKPLQCDKCSRRFINNSALAYHLKSHIVGRKQFECPICKDSFVYVLQLKVHVKQHCVNGQYTCPFCKKQFFKYSVVRKHIRAFHCERKHSCPHCSKPFPTLDKLRMHLLKHSDHREFLCADCGKQFKRKDKLKEHCKRMHSEERENAEPKFVPKVQPTDYHRFIYKCHSCMVGFKRRGMLVNHLAKRHPDISPNSVPELNLPILRATRNYFCQYCDKIYKSSSKRKAHILKNHPGSELPLSNRTHSTSTDLPNPTYSQTVGSVTTHPQSCHWCYKQYASKAKLLQHLRKKHSDLLQMDVESKTPQPKNNDLEMKVTDDEILAQLGQDYQLVSMDGFAQQGDADSRLYRLLTSANNMAPPR